VNEGQTASALLLILVGFAIIVRTARGQIVARVRGLF
jgi:ABC-type nickel/cobalt efflux system permease component RcnA